MKFLISAASINNYCFFIVEMRQSVIILVIVALIKSSESQYPSCINNCPTGKSLWLNETIITI